MFLDVVLKREQVVWWLSIILVAKANPSLNPRPIKHEIKSGISLFEVGISFYENNNIRLVYKFNSLITISLWYIPEL